MQHAWKHVERPGGSHTALDGKKIQNIPSQRLADLEAAIRQLRQIGCILDGCTISASYEVTQARLAFILTLDHVSLSSFTALVLLTTFVATRRCRCLLQSVRVNVMP